MIDLKGFEIFIVLFNEFQTPRGYSLEGDQRCHGSDVTGTWFEPIPVSLDISHTLYIRDPLFDKDGQCYQPQ